MNEEEKALWQKINAYDPDEPDASFSFTSRLARENDWSLDYALQALHEYKKFMFLLCVSGKPLTPSDEVDQVWHLHLIYSKLYWEDFCTRVLQRNIHHNPTQGGQAEGEKFTDWYAQTFIEYQKYFDKTPPSNIWPPAKIRFGEIIFTRVNKHRFWVLKKPKWFIKWKS
jgi:hypothetical protein